MYRYNLRLCRGGYPHSRPLPLVRVSICKPTRHGSGQHHRLRDIGALIFIRIVAPFLILATNPQDIFRNQEY